MPNVTNDHLRELAAIAERIESMAEMPELEVARVPLLAWVQDIREILDQYVK